MRTVTQRSAEGLMTLHTFLQAEGVRDAFQTVATKEVLAWKIGQAIKIKERRK